VLYDKPSSTVDTSTTLECPEVGQPLKVQITVLTAHPDAPTATSVHTLIDDGGNPIALEGDTGLTTTVSGEELLRREIEVHLTDHFVDSEGAPVCDGDDCIRFEVEEIRFRTDIEDSSCTELLGIGTIDDPSFQDMTAQELANTLAAAVNSCSEDALRDPEAINLYIYDSCGWTAAGVPDCSNTDGHGRENPSGDLYSPYVLLDLARLQHQTQSPEEHEFGHALGLPHNCDPDIDSQADPSNIMQSQCNGAGSGGARNQGFGDVEDFQLHTDDCDTGELGCFIEADQVAVLMETVRAVQSSWCEPETTSTEETLTELLE
jgi:hypothetical protein